MNIQEDKHNQDIPSPSFAYNLVNDYTGVRHEVGETNTASADAGGEKTTQLRSGSGNAEAAGNDEERMNASSTGDNDYTATPMDEYYGIADIHRPSAIYQSKSASFWRAMCGNLLEYGSRMDTFRVPKI